MTNIKGEMTHKGTYFGCQAGISEHSGEVNCIVGEQDNGYNDKRKERIEETAKTFMETWMKLSGLEDYIKKYPPVMTPFEDLKNKDCNIEFDIEKCQKCGKLYNPILPFRLIKHTCEEDKINETTKN